MDKIHALIATEPEGGIVYSGGWPEEPPTIDGAIRVATRMIEFIRNQGYPLPQQPKPARKVATVQVSVDGEPGPKHYSGACPRCEAPLNGVLPAKVPSQVIECPACHTKLKVAHTPEHVDLPVLSP